MIQPADAAVLVGVENPSFFRTMVPTFSAAETIVALVAATAGKQAETTISLSEA